MVKVLPQRLVILLGCSSSTALPRASQFTRVGGKSTAPRGYSTTSTYIQLHAPKCDTMKSMRKPKCISSYPYPLHREPTATPSSWYRNASIQLNRGRKSKFTWSTPFIPNYTPRMKTNTENYEAARLEIGWEERRNFMAPLPAVPKNTVIKKEQYNIYSQATWRFCIRKKKENVASWFFCRDRWDLCSLDPLSSACRPNRRRALHAFQ